MYEAGYKQFDTDGAIHKIGRALTDDSASYIARALKSKDIVYNPSGAGLVHFSYATWRQLDAPGARLDGILTQEEAGPTDQSRMLGLQQGLVVRLGRVVTTSQHFVKGRVHRGLQASIQSVVTADREPFSLEAEHTWLARELGAQETKPPFLYLGDISHPQKMQNVPNAIPSIFTGHRDLYIVRLLGVSVLD